MACDCPEYTCLLPVPAILQCGAGIVVNLIPGETETWIMSYEFNGVWYGVNVEATENTLLEIPNVFNENYTHSIRFYNPSGELIGDTCYTFDTRSLIRFVSGSSPVQPSVPGTFAKVTVEAGNTIPFVLGEPVIIFVEAQSYYNGFTWNGSEIEMTNGVEFYEGQEIGIIYV